MSRPGLFPSLPIEIAGEIGKRQFGTWVGIRDVVKVYTTIQQVAKVAGKYHLENIIDRVVENKVIVVYEDDADLMDWFLTRPGRTKPLEIKYLMHVEVAFGRHESDNAKRTEISEKVRNLRSNINRWSSGIEVLGFLGRSTFPDDAPKLRKFLELIDLADSGQVLHLNTARIYNQLDYYAARIRPRYLYQHEDYLVDVYVDYQVTTVDGAYKIAVTRHQSRFDGGRVIGSTQGLDNLSKVKFHIITDMYKMIDTAVELKDVMKFLQEGNVTLESLGLTDSYTLAANANLNRRLSYETDAPESIDGEKLYYKHFSAEEIDFYSLSKQTRPSRQPTLRTFVKISHAIVNQRVPQDSYFEKSARAILAMYDPTVLVLEMPNLNTTKAAGPLYHAFVLQKISVIIKVIVDAFYWRQANARKAKPALRDVYFCNSPAVTKRLLLTQPTNPVLIKIVQDASANLSKLIIPPQLRFHFDYLFPLFDPRDADFGSGNMKALAAMSS
jgi:hypothetical protein